MRRTILLLPLVLIVGPAFLPRDKHAEDNMPVLDFVAYKTVDAMVSGGGNPNAKPPPGSKAAPEARPGSKATAPSRARRAHPPLPGVHASHPFRVTGSGLDVS